MAACLFGLEAELALSAAKAGVPVPVETAAVALARVARRRLVHLPGGSGRMYLANGSLFYVDVGHHPEAATPECTTPWQAVSHLRAAERMVAELAQHLPGEIGVDQVRVGRGNVDYASGATWGCHESYLARLPVQRYQDWLVPHLASRTLFTGSGGLDPSSPGIRFSTSPRVAHLTQVVSAESTAQRGIFHTRDEALATGYNRLHVLAGDNACSQLATLLKVGTTALVVALAEIGGKPLVRLKQPVQAMQGFARDSGQRAEVEVQRRCALMSAFDIQQQYVAAVEAHANTAAMPDWAPILCAAWRAALARLGGDAAAAGHAFDWPLKRELFGRELRHSGFDWPSVAKWSDALERLKSRWPAQGDASVAVDPAWPHRLRAAIVGGGNLADDARREFGARGLDGNDLDAFIALRQRLCAIDVRFGSIGNGIFDTLDRQGLLPDHHAVSEREIAAAANDAPGGSRASVRATWIRRLDSQRDRYCCGWQGIQGANGGSSYLDLSDPFAVTGEWRRVGAA